MPTSCGSSRKAVTACLLHNESASHCAGPRLTPPGGSRSESESETGVPGRAQWTRSQSSYPWPGRTPGNAGRRAEPVGAEKPSEELRIGAKDLSRLVIAGSPRNAFRDSLGTLPAGGRALHGRWPLHGVLTPRKLRMPVGTTPGVRRREINSAVERETAQTACKGPQETAQSPRMWDREDSQDVGSEAATI